MVNSFSQKLVRRNATGTIDGKIETNGTEKLVGDISTQSEAVSPGVVYVVSDSYSVDGDFSIVAANDHTIDAKYTGSTSLWVNLFFDITIYIRSVNKSTGAVVIETAHTESVGATGRDYFKKVGSDSQFSYTAGDTLVTGSVSTLTNVSVRDYIDGFEESKIIIEAQPKLKAEAVNNDAVSVWEYLSPAEYKLEVSNGQGITAFRGGRVP
jgi:hypothetical protein